MTAATGLKRLAIGIAAVVLGSFAVLTVTTYLIPAQTVRDAVTAQIKTVTGLDVSVRGGASVSLFPSGTITLSNVVMGDDGIGEPGLVASEIVARLRFFPLLTGRIEISDVSLIRPRIAMTFENDGRSNWSGLVQALANALKSDIPTGNRVQTFSEIRIEDGVILIRDKSRGVSETLTDAELSLAWPSISKSFGTTGRFVWHDKPIDVGLSLSNFLAALNGDRTGLKFRLNGALLKVAFDGAMSVRPTLKIEGTTAADAASLRKALVWAGLTPLPGGGFGRFALKAQTNVTGGTISLSGANLELDGNTAEGVLTFATDGRKTLQGTLASETLDLTPYISTVRLLTNERDWNRVPIMLDGLTGTDLDLRLSAAKITVANAKFGRTAIAANLRGGKLMVTVGESQSFNGLIQGSVGLAKSSVGAELKTQLQFTDVDLDSCMSELFGIHRLEGKGDLGLSLEASGMSVLALTRTMNGAAKLTGREGAIVGINVEQLLRRLDRRPLSGRGNEFRTGRTPFDKFDVTIKIAQGVATVEDVRLEGEAVRLGINGTASIPTRDLDLKGTASLVSATDGAKPFELPFVVQGPWEDPIMLPDTQALIRRSGSAAPLLESVTRDRRTREAVRSAIERLTGTTLPALPPDIQPAAQPQPGQ